MNKVSGDMLELVLVSWDLAQNVLYQIIHVNSKKFGEIQASHTLNFKVTHCKHNGHGIQRDYSHVTCLWRHQRHTSRFWRFRTLPRPNSRDLPVCTQNMAL